MNIEDVIERIKIADDDFDSHEIVMVNCRSSLNFIFLFERMYYLVAVSAGNFLHAGINR
jgi:hypothetical protein